MKNLNKSAFMLAVILLAVSPSNVVAYKTSSVSNSSFLVTTKTNNYRTSKHKVEPQVIEYKYLPYIEISGTKFFNVSEGSWASGIDMFLPIWQEALRNLVFTHLRLYDRSGQSFEGNIHLGYRYLADDSLYGVYGAFDRRKSNYGNYFNQLTFGVEWWLKQLFIGANYYHPIGKELALTGVDEEAKLNKIKPYNYNILLTRDQRGEIPARGADLDIGYELVPGLTGYIGGYYFKAPHIRKTYGPKARLAYNHTLQNGQKVLGVFDKLGLELGVRHDNFRGIQGYMSLNLRVGLLPSKYNKLEGVAKHMVDLIQRDVDIVTMEGVVAKGKPEVAKDKEGKEIRLIAMEKGTDIRDLNITPATTNIIAWQDKCEQPTIAQAALLKAINGQLWYEDKYIFVSPYSSKSITLDIASLYKEIPPSHQETKELAILPSEPLVPSPKEEGEIERLDQKQTAKNEVSIIEEKEGEHATLLPSPLISELHLYDKLRNKTQEVYEALKKATVDGISNPAPFGTRVGKYIARTKAAKVLADNIKHPAFTPDIVALFPPEVRPYVIGYVAGVATYVVGTQLARVVSPPVPLPVTTPIPKEPPPATPPTQVPSATTSGITSAPTPSAPSSTPEETSSGTSLAAPRLPASIEPASSGVTEIPTTSTLGSMRGEEVRPTDTQASQPTVESSHVVERAHLRRGEVSQVREEVLQAREVAPLPADLREREEAPQARRVAPLPADLRGPEKRHIPKPTPQEQRYLQSQGGWYREHTPRHMHHR